MGEVTIIFYTYILYYSIQKTQIKSTKAVNIGYLKYQIICSTIRCHCTGVASLGDAEKNYAKRTHYNYYSRQSPLNIELQLDKVHHSFYMCIKHRRTGIMHS